MIQFHAHDWAGMGSSVEQTNRAGAPMLSETKTCTNQLQQQHTTCDPMQPNITIKFVEDPCSTIVAF